MTRADSVTVDVSGVPFAATTLSDATNWLIDQALRVRNGERVVAPVRLMNSYCVALASHDPTYMTLVTSDKGINFPDGAPVAWMIRRLGAPHGRQVRGPSLFTQVIDQGRRHQLRHYLFGSTPATIRLLTRALENEYVGVCIAGSDPGRFAPVDEILSEDTVDAIRAAKPEIVWVGIGTPKQDYVAARLAELLGVPCVGIGAAFDFVAGTAKEASPILTKLGLEWMFRLMAEPRRLWRRYLWGNTRFIRLAAKRLVAPERRAP